MKRHEDDILSQKEQQLRRLSSINQNLVASRIELTYRRNTLSNEWLIKIYFFELDHSATAFENSFQLM